MPNKAPSPAKASRERLAQRIDRSIAAACASRVEVVGTSWSKAMTMSAPSNAWISIDRSGVSMCRLPSRWLANATPSSLTLVRSARLITW